MEDKKKILAACSADNLVSICYQAALEGGWHNDPATGKCRSVVQNDEMVPTRLMLIVSEVAEAMEGHRKNLQDDHLPHRSMLEVELADAVIRICDLAGCMGLDLGGAIADKLAYNAQRTDHKIEVRKAAGGKRY